MVNSGTYRIMKRT